MTKREPVFTTRQLKAMADAREAREKAKAACERATKLFRQQVALMERMGATNRVIADQLGVSCAAVNKELHRS